MNKLPCIKINHGYKVVFPPPESNMIELIVTDLQ